MASLTSKVNTDLSSTISSFSSSLTALRTSLSAFQEEVSRGPNSTYNRVMSARTDTKLHPEMNWDATVRLGRELADAERDFVEKRRRTMVAAFARILQVEEREIDPRDLPIIGVAGSGGGYRAMVNTLGNVAGAKEMYAFHSGEER